MNLPARPDVIALSETKLKPTFPVQIYSISGFNLFNCSRIDGSGGGVLVYVRSTIPTDRINLPPTSFERVQLSLHPQLTVPQIAPTLTTSWMNLKSS
jgi:exonuclease III